jgi:hypothetical protein
MSEFAPQVAARVVVEKPSGTSDPLWHIVDRIGQSSGRVR